MVIGVSSDLNIIYHMALMLLDILHFWRENVKI